MQYFSVKIKEMDAFGTTPVSFPQSSPSTPSSLCFSLSYSAHHRCACCARSILLYMHMSAQLNESPELTADGALWVCEALICLLSPLFMQSIIILLLCLLPQDH